MKRYPLPRACARRAALSARRRRRLWRRRREGRDDAGRAGAEKVSGSVSIIGIWTGDEQKSFQAVIDGFNEAVPGRQRSVHLRRRQPADRALRPPSRAATRRTSRRSRSPAWCGSSQKRARSSRSTSPRTTIVAQLSAGGRRRSARSSGKLYGLVFKAANKSTVWYNVKAVQERRRRAADDVGRRSSTDAKTIKASGLPAYSIGGADGWTLTDLFENIYLRQAGPEKYDQLSDAQDQVDRPVGQGRRCTSMAQVLGDSDNIAGGTSGALQTDFPTSVEQRLRRRRRRRAMVIEGDFVPGVVAPTKLEAGARATTCSRSRRSTARRRRSSAAATSSSMFKDTPAIQAFVEYLATPGGARRSGPSGAASRRRTRTSPRAPTRTRSRARPRRRSPRRKTFRFDMSDLQPAAFGGRPARASGRSSRTSSRTRRTSTAPREQLESAAAKAYK